MGIRSIIVYVNFLLALAATRSYAETADSNLIRVQKLFTTLKNTEEISYDYSIKVRYPNDQKDHLAGTVYINTVKKILCNLSDASALIYSARWFYKADHSKQTVTIVDLAKQNDKESKKSAIEKDVFQNGSLKGFIDSVVIKSGKLKSFTIHHDTVRAELGFPPKTNIQSLSVVFNGETNELYEYQVKTFQATAEENGKVVGITESITSGNFRKNGDNKAFQIDDYFSIDQQKVVLHKYNKYKLYSKL